MKIKKYVKPELIDLNYSSVRGNCATGSVDADECTDGGQAVANCTQHGTTAGSNCSGHGITAEAWCTSDGSFPVVGCLTGSSK